MGLPRTVALFWFTNFCSKIKASYFFAVCCLIESHPDKVDTPTHTGVYTDLDKWNEPICILSTNGSLVCPSFPSIFVLFLHVLPGRMWEMGSSNTHIKSCRDKVDSITNYSHTAGSAVKTPPADAGDPGLISRVVKIPWTRKWQPAPVLMPGKSRGHRSLVGYGPRGCKRIRHKLVTKYQNQGSLSPIIPSFWALLNMI